MSGIPDIDIERLREAVDMWNRFGPRRGDNPGTPLSDLNEIVNAARFLVSLADQGGELWMENNECGECGDDGGGVRVHRINCPSCLGYGGSRVRVWPKEATDA